MNPTLYEINTRVWLKEISLRIGRPATLDDILDSELDQLAMLGFDWIWLLSVWSTGLVGRNLARRDRELRKEFEQTLPDFREDDIAGSGFAITGYSVHPALGGEPALARLRHRLKDRGLRLMLDFIPNHTALDHPWVHDFPEYYLAGNEDDLAREPRNYARLQSVQGDVILAHGRDPYFPAWTDTLQLDYSNPATQKMMCSELVRVAGLCDGVRCDMAMLLLPEVIARIWHRRAEAFWPRAISAVRDRDPEFCFLAEVYWGLESTLLQQGFDYAYDKELYDKLVAGVASQLREHLRAPIGLQERLARFLENHDERRSAAVFPKDKLEAAAVIAYLSPGLKLFHQGQLAGCLKRISAHLVRAPVENEIPSIKEFYHGLLKLLRRPELRDGEWRLLECNPEVYNSGNSNVVLPFVWAGAGQVLLVAVNYADQVSRCVIELSSGSIPGGRVQLTPLLVSGHTKLPQYDTKLHLFRLELPPWGFQVLALSQA